MFSLKQFLSRRKLDLNHYFPNQYVLLQHAQLADMEALFIQIEKLPKTHNKMQSWYYDMANVSKGFSADEIKTAIAKSASILTAAHTNADTKVTEYYLKLIRRINTYTSYEHNSAPIQHMLPPQGILLHIPHVDEAFCKKHGCSVHQLTRRIYHFGMSDGTIILHPEFADDYDRVSILSSGLQTVKYYSDLIGVVASAGKFS